MKLEREVMIIMKQHLFYYLSLCLMQATSVYLVYIYSGNLPAQMTAVSMMSLLFIVWAILHQYLHHTLHPKIVIEYVLVASIGICATFFLLA